MNGNIAKYKIYEGTISFSHSNIVEKHVLYLFYKETFNSVKEKEDYLFDVLIISVLILLIYFKSFIIRSLISPTVNLRINLLAIICKTELLVAII